MSFQKAIAVGRNTKIRELAQQVARQVFAADDVVEAIDIAATVNPELVLFDYRFNCDCLREFLRTTDKNPSTHVIVVGGDDVPADTRAKFIEMGVCEYLDDIRDHQQFKQIINQIQNKVNAGASRKNTDGFFADDLSASVSMAGRSKAALDTLKMIKLVAESQCNPVLIVGETGTGKELAAKAIHNLKHPGEQFVAVNCAALTANLLESELFGHVKGSFTSAESEKTGLFELAGAGTIFLDEITEMPMELQPKLLRVLQEKSFRKVGGTEEIRCKATIIISSNRNLKAEVESNRFRRDLYYRLNICPVSLVPLRSARRRGDIKLLADYFIKTSNICPNKETRATSITELALEALQEHDWPGNVRELQNVIDRAILLESTEKIGLSSIVIDPTDSEQLCESTTADKIRDFSLLKAERELIARALEETGWQKTRAASLLGITRATLYAKVKQHNIEKGSYIAKQIQDDISAVSSSEPAGAVC